jgi:hypothetical protein
MLKPKMTGRTNKPTRKQEDEMITKVFYRNKLFGTVLTEAEYLALSADDLRLAIDAYAGPVVVRRPCGALDMCDMMSTTSKSNR